MVGAPLECLEMCLQSSQPSHPDQTKSYVYIQQIWYLMKYFEMWSAQ